MKLAQQPIAVNNTVVAKKLILIKLLLWQVNGELKEIVRMVVIYL